MDRELMDSMREHPSTEPVLGPNRTGSERNPPIVLIVDDNPQNLELIQAYLEDVECVTVPAYNGLEALDLAARKKPDLILLDVMMPKMSGFEVCRRIKSNPETSTIPIIMVTALSEFGDIERGIDCGTDDFVSKPVNRLELLTRVRTMLKLKHLTDTLQRTMAYLSEIEQQTQPSPSGKAP
jgi:two-component system, OmpR family, alkaline phosphatase synthesis response regulator PhoP